MKIYLSQPVSVRHVTWTAADEAAMAAFALEPSNFEEDNFRKLMWQQGIPRHHYILGNGNHLYVCGPSPPSSQLLKVMGQIMRAMKRDYKVFWFMSDARRLFPESKSIVGPTNVNGGYCRACEPDTIVIYRKEDALRVLIHELQHAGCLDDHSATLPMLEARTEAWAELIYAMVGAVVHGLKPEVAWAKQVAWSRGQNNRLRTEFDVVGPDDYAWRYTVGKEEVWASMDLISGAMCAPTREHPASWPNSLQLGCPELDIGA